MDQKSAEELTERELAEVVLAARVKQDEKWRTVGFTTEDFCIALEIDPEHTHKVRGARKLLVALKEEGLLVSQKVLRPNIHGELRRTPGWRWVKPE